MNRKHIMPFGAEFRAQGETCFRLWAPRASSVGLRLSEAERQLPMAQNDGGWFELTTAAQTGARYQYIIDNQHLVPDPASRFQPSGVHGPSEIVDPHSFAWKDALWCGRSWNEAVIYELHVGTFSPEGTFTGAEKKLDYLAELGITAVELMPVGSFPGQRNWGYDGVLPYAPAASYGRPDDLKQFIQTAHAKNLMVLLDVVYNHFGPEGNYLSLYARDFFTDRHRTPWGQAINFDGSGSRVVRDFFIHNALYWLKEYHIDGLRLDAVHAIVDDSRPHILNEMAAEIRARLGATRQIHLVLENDNNGAHFLRPRVGSADSYTAQWNDDIHHALHVMVSGEIDGYYSDYAEAPERHLGRCLTEGYSYQGEPSAFRHGCPRGEPSRDLPLTSFVAFLQNHDQVGNRALGERILEIAEPAAVRAALAILLLAPSPPLLFMGEEFATKTPFLFFCNFGSELAAKVRDGRRAEFLRFEQFRSPQSQSKIPDPNLETTFLHSKLDWRVLEQPSHREWLAFYRELLALRRQHIVPRIKDIVPGETRYEVLAASAVHASWGTRQGNGLELFANLSSERVPLEAPPQGSMLYSTAGNRATYLGSELPPFAAAWLLTA